MILDLDVGNTRCKWRLIDAEGQVLTRGANDVEQLGQLVVGAHNVRRVRVSSVGNAQRDLLVSGWAQSRFGVVAEFAGASARVRCVRNGYSAPAQLGVDRWLGVVAAFEEVRAGVCVVDCGSAITSDFVDRDGFHRGGYITPGLSMMRSSLQRGTSRVRFDNGPRATTVQPGNETGQAVYAGTLLAAAGFVTQAVEQFRRECMDAVILITGGDGPIIAELLAFPVVQRPDLVLDGLALALP